MDAFERKWIASFLASNSAPAAKERLKQLAWDVQTARDQSGLGLSDDGSFNATSKQQVLEFLTAVLNLSANRDGHGTDEDQFGESLQKLVEKMESLSLTVIPLVLVSLNPDENLSYLLCSLKVSILVKVIATSGDISYMDLAGRQYLTMEEFLQHCVTPFGVLCYLEVLNAHRGLDIYIYRYAIDYKLVGKQLAYLCVDGFFSGFNVVGSLGLLALHRPWVMPIGMLAVGSSIYLMARGAMGLLEVKCYGGLRSKRSILFNILLTGLNFGSVELVSLPYSFGLMHHLSGRSKALLGFCAGMNLLWLLLKPSLHSYGWIDVLQPNRIHTERTSIFRRIRRSLWLSMYLNEST